MSAAWDEPAWRAVAAELAAWHEDGRAAALWWRDDDAGAPHPGLDRVLALAARAAVPVGLAVVPAWLSTEVARAIDGAPASVVVLQHGWAHQNHETASPPDQRRVKPAECGAARPAAAVLAELRDGHARLGAAFGRRFLPVLVPPWNRIAPEIVRRLPEAGYRALSAFGAGEPGDAGGVRLLNCHTDPIVWRDGKRFAGAAATLERLRTHLTDRRAGRAPRGAATGLLTHHRDMAPPFWEFVETLFARLRETPGAVLPPIAALVDAGP